MHTIEMEMKNKYNRNKITGSKTQRKKTYEQDNRDINDTNKGNEKRRQ
jgi:hypothetical protein